MATTILDEWTGYGLANGEHLDYSKAIAGALHGLDPAIHGVASIVGHSRRAVAHPRRLPRKTQIRPVASLVQEGRDGSRRFVCRRMQRTLSQFSKTNH